MPASDALPFPRKNVAYRVTFPILDADGDLVTGAAGLDSEVSKDGGAFADATNEATEIATSSGMYFLDLTATEMNADTVSVIVKTTTTGAKTTPIVLYPIEDGDIRANVVNWNGVAPSNLNSGAVQADVQRWLNAVANALIAGRVDANAQVVGDKTGYRLDTELRRGTAQAGAAGSITLDAGASATDGFYNDLWCAIVGGTGAGQCRLADGYTGSSKVLTIRPNWAVNPDATSVFSLIAVGRMDLALFVGQAPPTPAVTGVPKVDLTHIVGSVVDATLAQIGANLAQLRGDSASAQNLERSASAIYRGTVTSGPTATSFADSGLTQGDADFWKGRIILFTSGTLRFQGTKILTFTPATDTLTFDQLTQAPAVNDTYVIV